MAQEDRKIHFIEKALKVHHNENLDYSQVVYKNNRTPVKIIDHDLREDGTEYGEFWQTPTNHLKGQTHPDKRGKRISASKQSKQEEVIKRFKQVHKGENLDYSQVEYKGMHVKVKIISHDLRPDGTEYGEFWQEPIVHLKGCSHPEISRNKQSFRQTYTTDEFVQKCKLVHKDKDYIYDYVKYVGSQIKVKIYCNKTDSKGKPHGMFDATPDNFLLGKGCPKCGNHLSTGEDEIYEYIGNLIGKNNIKKGDRSVLNGKELDIYIPSLNIAFEFNGLRWHSELFNKDKYYHYNKTKSCKDKGVTLYHIFEDEFLYHKHALLAKIKRLINCDDNLIKIHARKCVISEIRKEEAQKFLDRNHIQGYCKSTIYLGAFYEATLESVMCFLKGTNDEWTLVRYASNTEHLVRGVASKMLKYFISHYNVYQIKTFLDRRWEYNPENNVYIKCGFVIDSYLKPDYHYTNGHGERLHKFGFRKSILHNKYGLPLSMTESEMTKRLGYYKIWDCGLIKYVYKNPNYL